MKKEVFAFILLYISCMGCVSAESITWNFNSDGNYEGWFDQGNRMSENVAGGVLNYTIAGEEDPQWRQITGISPLDPGKDITFKVVLKRTAGSENARTVFFVYNGTAACQIGGLVLMADHNDWQTLTFQYAGGTVPAISQIRFDPASGRCGSWSIDSISALQATDGKPKPVLGKVGEFSREGEYIKDYYVFREGETFHLFYNVGVAGAKQKWQEPGNEKAFGHATSRDLKTWEHHPRILAVVPGTWEGAVVSAPSVIRHNGLYYLFYTGFDDRVNGKQSIGFATSTDLFKWERYPGNPVYEAPDWTARNKSGWLDCRDAHVIQYGDGFLLFTMVTTAVGKGAIAVASSPDLLNWTDLGPAVVTFTAPESPRVFEHNGMYYMFASSAHGKALFKTSDPKTGPWQSLPFQWPAPGMWSGWEVVDTGDRTVFSAFEWKMFGNRICFWDVRWNGDVPCVVY